MFARLFIISILLRDQWITSDTIEHDTELSSKSFIEFYEQGVQSYLSSEYEDCVYFLEVALDKYRKYYESISSCRIECEYESRDTKNKGDYLHSNDIENLHFYELILKRTLYLSKCRKRNIKYFPFEEDFDGYFMELFKNRYAYTYLHACYTKTNKITLAASAALTYLVTNPADQIMKKNFALAVEKEGVDSDQIIDLEEKKFVKLFVSGILAMNSKDWHEGITSMESSIMQFISDENQCRAYCEGEFDHGFLPDFISSIGNHFTNTLYCKKNCTRDMGMVRGKYYENLFSEHYRYLQLAYFEEKQYEESFRAGVSYLLFKKDDSDMSKALKNMKKYIKLTIDDNFFKIRREAAEYYDRMMYEEKLVSFIKAEFYTLQYENDKPNKKFGTIEGNGNQDGIDEEEWRQTDTVNKDPSNIYLRDEL